MLRLMKCLALVSLVFLLSAFADSRTAEAQVSVTTYYVDAPSVHYLPVRRGLFGLRRGYVPVVSSPAPVAVTSYYAPAAPVTTYYAPPAPVTTYYAPAAPVTTYYAPAAPVVTYYAPPVATTTYYAPAAPVTTYYAPAAPVVAEPVTTYYPGTVVIGN